MDNSNDTTNTQVGEKLDDYKYDWCLYHDNCDDGFGAAFAYWRWKMEYRVSTPTIFHPCQYNKPLKILNDEQYPRPRKIYVLDFSFPPEILDELATRTHPAYKNILLDHHKTAVAQLSDYYNDAWLININKDNSESGAMMAWKHFFGKHTIPNLIRYIDDRDRWQFKLPESKEFTANLRSFPRTFEAWNCIYSSTNSQDMLDQFLQDGRAQLRLFDQYLKSNMKRAVLIGGIPIVNCSPEYSSDLGNLLCDHYQSPYSICFNTDGDTVYCSLRSIGDYDVSVLAQKFGGGGHKNASGFSMPITRFLESYFIQQGKTN